MANFHADYLKEEPQLNEITNAEGLTLIEFSAPWCPICQKAQPAIEEVLNAQPPLTHLKVFDGKGKPLGRAFKVKLWPTLVLLKDGEEIFRSVRPMNTDAVSEIFSNPSVN